MFIILSHIILVVEFIDLSNYSAEAATITNRRKVDDYKIWRELPFKHSLTCTDDTCYSSELILLPGAVTFLLSEDEIIIKYQVLVELFFPLQLKLPQKIRMKSSYEVMSGFCCWMKRDAAFVIQVPVWYLDSQLWFWNNNIFSITLFEESKQAFLTQVFISHTLLYSHGVSI